MAGRPRSFDRDDALECAIDAFWARGYEATSISELTQAIGIGAPSLYAAFGDKRALFDEAAARYLQRLEEGMDAALAAPTAREAVERVLRASAGDHTARQSPRGCLVMSEPLLADARAEVRDRVARRIEAGARAGELAPGADPEALADLVDLLIAGMSARARDGAGHERLAAAIDAFLAAWPAAA
jgi:AcrR family transcriptional regulator